MKESAIPSTVRVALIGGGAHGLIALAAAVSHIPGWSISVVVDPDPDARSRAAAILPGVKLFTAVHMLFTAADSFDFIVIATPPSISAAIANEALAARRPILLEKPGAHLSSGLDSLAAASEGHRVSLAYSYRFHPSVIAFHRAITAPDFGRIARLDLTFTAPMDARGTWREKRGSGGGALRDLGTHLLDLARLWLPEPLVLEQAVIAGDDGEATLDLKADGTHVHLRCAYRGRPAFSLAATGEDSSVSCDLWSMTTPASSPLAKIASRLRTKLPGPYRPARALLLSRMDTLRAAMASATSLAPATPADAAAILRLVEEAEILSRA